MDRWFPDPGASRAVLVGVSAHSSPELPHLPEAQANLIAFADSLTHPEVGPILREHCRVLHNPASQLDVAREIREAAQQATDLLLVYYCGNVGRDPDGPLHLTLPGTEPGLAQWSALTVPSLLRLMASARAKAAVLIVDGHSPASDYTRFGDEPPGTLFGPLDYAVPFALAGFAPAADIEADLRTTRAVTGLTAEVLALTGRPEPLPLGEVALRLNTPARPGKVRVLSQDATGAVIVRTGPAPAAGIAEPADLTPLTAPNSREAVKLDRDPPEPRGAVAGLGCLGTLGLIGGLVAGIVTHDGALIVSTAVALPVALVGTIAGSTTRRDQLQISGTGVTLLAHEDRTVVHRISVSWRDVEALTVLDGEMRTSRGKKGRPVVLRLRPGAVPAVSWNLSPDTAGKRRRHQRAEIPGWLVLTNLRAIGATEADVRAAMGQAGVGSLYHGPRELL